MSFKPESNIEFVTLTRGGLDGVIAILEVDGERKYFELQGLISLLESSSSKAQQRVFLQAIDAIQSAQNFDEIPEFEGSIPEQGSLF